MCILVRAGKIWFLEMFINILLKIFGRNQKKLSTTATVFGNELHRYSIADGIRDKNVLGFDPYKVLTYKDKDLREAVALEKAKATTIIDVIKDPKKSKIFYEYMNLSMAGSYDKSGNYNKGSRFRRCLR